MKAHMTQSVYFLITPTKEVYVIASVCLFICLQNNYLRQGGYVFAWVCLFVSLFVNRITQKLMDGF